MIKGFALTGDSIYYRTRCSKSLSVKVLMKTLIKLISVITLFLFIGGCAHVSHTPIKDDFSGWSCYIEQAGYKQQDVWKIEDGVLVCTGTPRGYLYTNYAYRDFTMTLQWRWPEGVGEGKGGVLIDAAGENKIWPKSLEAQINAGGAGDFWALDGYRITGATDRIKSLSHEQYGELINISKIAPAENAPGQWNRYKIIAKGATVTLIVNDHLVNKAIRMNTSGGKICITSEGTPIEFRDINIVAH